MLACACGGVFELLIAIKFLGPTILGGLGAAYAVMKDNKCRLK